MPLQRGLTDGGLFAATSALYLLSGLPPALTPQAADVLAVYRRTEIDLFQDSHYCYPGEQGAAYGGHGVALPQAARGVMQQCMLWSRIPSGWTEKLKFAHHARLQASSPASGTLQRPPRRCAGTWRLRCGWRSSRQAEAWRGLAWHEGRGPERCWPCSGSANAGSSFQAASLLPQASGAGQDSQVPGNEALLQQLAVVEQELGQASLRRVSTQATPGFVWCCRLEAGSAPAPPPGKAQHSHAGWLRAPASPSAV